MKLDQALENIRRVTNKLPKEEFSCIRDNKEKAIPALLECVKKVADMGESLPEDYDAHTYAMFLLAEFRVHEAFSYLVTYLEFDNDFTYRLVGDMLAEIFGSILASVATIEDISRLKFIVENNELYLHHRLTALDAMHTLYAEDMYDQDDYFVYLRHLLDSHRDDDGSCAYSRTQLARLIFSESLCNCRKTIVADKRSILALPPPIRLTHLMILLMPSTGPFEISG